MRIEISIDGTRVVKIEVDRDALLDRLTSPPPDDDPSFWFSPEITVAQARELITRLNSKTVIFLRELAKKDDGVISWSDTQKLFGITEWKEFSNSYNRGITRALRNVTGDSGAWLVNWDDNEWDKGNESLFIKGPALDALRQAFALE